MKQLVLPFILQFVGISIVILEMIVPSGGILALLSIGIIGYSLYLVFTTVSTSIGITFVAVDAVLIPLALLVGLKLLAKSPAALKTSLSKESGVQSQSPELDKFMGAEGVAISDLRPSGTALLLDCRVDVVSRGEYIEKSSPIIVRAITGNQIIVSKKE